MGPVTAHRWFAAAGLFLLASCATDRRLWIESEPAGATVRLDEELLGITPLELEFYHYGTRRLALELDGHLKVERDLEVAAPWYLRFPLDIVTEVLLPFGWNDHREVRVQLVPTPEVIAADEYEAARARAEAFRTAGDAPPKDLPPLGSGMDVPLVAGPRKGA
ncbi:MAG: PEGA domain-containing protein [Planctomycetota bacterium]|nr:PEGA domain-containing protein [Planctomycetota bacterium]